MFVEGFYKTAAPTSGGVAKGVGSWLKDPAKRQKLYKGLEYGGLGTLMATDVHDAYKAHQAGDKGHRNKALINTAALGALAGAVRLAH